MCIFAETIRLLLFHSTITTRARTVYQWPLFTKFKHELKILNDAYNSDRAEFIILYGRRRTGKTELLKQSKAE
jgi:predicted AAA+ superfamily ATPase